MRRHVPHGDRFGLGHGLGGIARPNLGRSGERSDRCCSNAENVYASATQLYVATTDWQFQSGWTCPPSPFEACPMEPANVPADPVSDTASTGIYAFDISDPSDPQYLPARAPSPAR